MLGTLAITLLKKIIVIPMGTNRAPLLVNRMWYTYYTRTCTKNEIL